MKNLASYNSFINESKLQDDYREFFTNVLKAYGVKSPAAFKGKPELGKKFYEDIKKGWNNGEGISKYGQDLLDNFKEEGIVKEGIDDLEPIENDDDIINDLDDDIVDDLPQDEYDGSGEEEEEQKNSVPSELWDESISKLLDIINSYDVESDVVASDTIKVLCDDNSDVVEEIVEEFNKTYPEYNAEYDADECTITIDEN